MDELLGELLLGELLAEDILDGVLNDDHVLSLEAELGDDHELSVDGLLLDLLLTLELDSLLRLLAEDRLE